MWGFVGRVTGVMWLASGFPGADPMELPAAIVFMLFGALLMLSWSRLSREASWVMLVIIGGAALLSGGSGLGEVVPVQFEWMSFAPIDRISGLMLFLIGVRIFSATRMHFLAAVLDGVILGMALMSIVGCVTGVEALLRLGPLGSLSWLEAVGFALLSSMFLYADVEYARINSRTRRSSLALGTAALAATISFRLADALFVSAGLDGILAVFTSNAADKVAVLAILQLLVSLTIAAAAIFLMGNSDSPSRLRVSRDECIRAENNQFKCAEYLNGELGDLEKARVRMQIRLERAEEELERCIAIIDPDDDGSNDRPPLAKALSAAHSELSTLVQEDTKVGQLSNYPCDRERVDLFQLFQLLAIRNGHLLNLSKVRLSLHRAGGFVFADRAILASCLNVLLRNAIGSASGALPYVDVGLKRRGITDPVDVIRITYSVPEMGVEEGKRKAHDEGPGRPEERVLRELCLASVAADVHGGTFRVAVEGRVWSYVLTLPADNRPSSSVSRVSDNNSVVKPAGIFGRFGVPPSVCPIV